MVKDAEKGEIGKETLVGLLFPITVSNFSDFKKKYLSKKGFKLIQRENFEMVELIDSQFEVRAYFSNPPLDKQLGIK